MSRFAKTEPLPFTFSEARQKLQPTGRDNWAFDLLNDYGMRDGLLVPHGNWAVLFWSERVLRDVSHETRLVLDASASAVVHRVKQLMSKKRVRDVELSPRELAALSHLARGLRLAAIAGRMELSKHTVRV